MLTFRDWFPLATVGVTFTVLGRLTRWGLNRAIVGGAGQPVVQRLCGISPAWESRSLRLGFPFLLLTIGLINLGRLAWMLISGK